MILALNIDEVRHAGYATAVATLQTAMWSGLQESPDAYFDCFTPEIKEEFRNALVKKTEQAKCGSTSPACSCDSGCEQIRGIRVYSEHIISDNEVELEYELDLGGGKGRRCRQPFRRVAGAWKISGPPQGIW
jgi:hypothetical protein